MKARFEEKGSGIRIRLEAENNDESILLKVFTQQKLLKGSSLEIPSNGQGPQYDGYIHISVGYLGVNYCNHSNCIPMADPKRKTRLCLLMTVTVITWGRCKKCRELVDILPSGIIVDSEGNILCTNSSIHELIKPRPIRKHLRYTP